MEIKKDDKHDLEKRKGVFFELGLLLALAAVFFAFEWKKYDETANDFEQMQVIDIPEELVEITKQEQPEPPKAQVQTTVLEIVDDDVEIENELEVDVEDNMNEVVAEFVAPVEEDEPVIVEAEIFTVVEEQPGFPGGEEALFEYLGKNISYPQMAKEAGIQGTVFATFVVEPDGSISNVKILRGIGGGCDDEAIRVVKKMPKWKAGKQRGKSVRVQFNLPIRFILQG